MESVRRVNFDIGVLAMHENMSTAKCRNSSILAETPWALTSAAMDDFVGIPNDRRDPCQSEASWEVKTLIGETMVFMNTLKGG